jgi:uncharacterized membrane protein YtjA (UPF0391 family)
MSDSLHAYNAGFVGIMFLIVSIIQYFRGYSSSSYYLFITASVVFLLQIVILLPCLIGGHNGKSH